MQNEDLQQALQTAEAWVEGGTDLAERKNARRAATAAALVASRASLQNSLTLSDSAAWAVQRLLESRSPQVERILFALAEAQLKDAGARAHLYDLPREIADQAREEAFESEQQAQVILLRDIFGNPFRPIPFELSWRTNTVISLAWQMYEARDFSAMPILADAIQEVPSARREGFAGCESADVLDHCRGSDPHVRGCWVVDLVLGKE
jgi:hypothetical protein